MEFEQQAQEDLYARVTTYLRQAFGELAEPVGDGPDFRLDLGRVHLLISIDANGPEKASVTVYNILGEGLAGHDRCRGFPAAQESRHAVWNVEPS